MSYNVKIKLMIIRSNIGFKTVLFYFLSVVYFDQPLGAVHAKRGGKSHLQFFLQKNFKMQKSNKFAVKICKKQVILQKFLTLCVF